MYNESSKNTNNLGTWLKEKGIKADKAIVWPDTSYSIHLLDEGVADNVVGLSPDMSHLDSMRDHGVAGVRSHDYTGNDFDFEYGWAIADDTIEVLEAVIDYETDNLHQYTFPNDQEMYEAINKSFSRISSTTDELLNDQDATVMYNLDGVGRYQMPQLESGIEENQAAYAEIMGDHLEDKGFSVSIYGGKGSNIFADRVSFSNDVHILGER